MLSAKVKKTFLGKPDASFHKILDLIRDKDDSVAQIIAKLDMLDIMVRMMSAEIKAAYGERGAKNKQILKKMGFES